MIHVDVAEEGIKAMHFGVVQRRGMTHSPFSHASGDVTGSTQDFGDRQVSWSEQGRVITADPGVASVVTLQQHRAGWSAYGRSCVVLGEAHALVGHGIEMRCFKDLLSVTSQISIAEIICQYVNDVGCLRWQGCTCLHENAECLNHKPKEEGEWLHVKPHIECTDPAAQPLYLRLVFGAKREGSG